MLLALTLLAGCTPKEDPPDLAVDTSPPVTCGGTAPVVLSLSVENGGFQEYEGASYATLALNANVEDLVDHDLDYLAMDAWWETPPDGVVDTTRDPDVDGDLRLIDDAPCRVSDAFAHIYAPIRDGGRLLPDTEYEFAVIVEDHSGDRSAAVIGSGWTPNLDGTDGGP